MRDNGEPKRPKERTGDKKDDKSSPQFASTHRVRSRMEVAIYVTGALCLIATIIAALFGSPGHRDLSIWTSFAAVCFAVLAGFCWLQNYHWNKDASATNAQTPKDRRDQRAWVAPIAFSGEPKANQPFTAYVRYKNTGKTVAKNVQVVFFANPYRKDEKPDFSIVEKEPVEGGAKFDLAPDGESTSYHTVTVNGAVLNDTDIKALESGDYVMFAFGKIYYMDIFRCHHWSAFCVSFDPKVKRYSVYKEYNDTDDDPCP